MVGADNWENSRSDDQQCCSLRTRNNPAELTTKKSTTNDALVHRRDSVSVGLEQKRQSKPQAAVTLPVVRVLMSLLPRKRNRVIARQPGTPVLGTLSTHNNARESTAGSGAPPGSRNYRRYGSCPAARYAVLTLANTRN